MSGSRRKLAAYLALAWIPHAIGYVVAPIAVAKLGGAHRRARSRNTFRPVGLPLVGGGAGLIVLAIVSHYRSSADEVQVTSNPDYLAVNGAYALTRNPLYVGGLTMWAGWSIVFASRRVAAVGGVLAGFLGFVGVPFEERRLAERFGSSYDEYRQRVPRWIGRPGGRRP